MRERLVLILFALATLAVLALLVVFDLDIDASRDNRNDVLFRSKAIESGLLPNRFLDPSPHAHWLPSDLHLRRNLREGHLPFWERRQGGGFSPYTRIDFGLFHPLRWVAALFPERQTESAFVVLTLAFAFAGAFCLVAEVLRLGLAASLVGAMVFTTTGAPLSHLLFGGLGTFLFLPWVLVGYFRWADRPADARFLGLVGLLALLVLSGHPALVFAVLLGVGSVALVEAFGRKRGWRALAGLAGAGFAALPLTGFLLVPFAASLRETWIYKTELAAGPSYVAYRWSIWFEALRATLFNPPEFFAIDYFHFYQQTGWLVVGLALTGMWQARRSEKFRLLGLLVLVFFLIGTPPPPLAFLGSAPMIGYCNPWYLLPLFTFVTAIAAALGAEAAIQLPIRRFRRVVAAAALLGIALPGALRLLEVASPRRAEPLAQSGGWLFLRRAEGPMRITGLWGQTHLPNLSEITGVEDLRVALPLLSRRYQLWFGLVDPVALDKSHPATRVTEDLRSPLLGGFNVRYVVQGLVPQSGMHSLVRPGRDLFDFLPALVVRDPSLPVVYRDAFVEILENRRFLRPRAYFADEVVTVAGGAGRAAAWMSENPARLGRTSVVEIEAAGGEGTGALAHLRAPDRGWIGLSYPGDAEVILDVESDRSALVVLAEAFDPGWRATLDGQPMAIHPVDVLSRGVVVPAGRHRVEMRFVPVGFGGGVATSLLTGAALVTAVVLRRRRRGGGGADAEIPLHDGEAARLAVSRPLAFRRTAARATLRRFTR